MIGNHHSAFSAGIILAPEIAAGQHIVHHIVTQRFVRILRPCRADAAEIAGTGFGDHFGIAKQPDVCKQRQKRLPERGLVRLLQIARPVTQMAQAQAFAQHMMLHMQQNDHAVVHIVRRGKGPAVKRGGMAVLHRVLHKGAHPLARCPIGDAGNLKMHFKMCIPFAEHYMADMIHMPVLVAMLLQQVGNLLPLRRVDQKVHIAQHPLLRVGIIGSRRHPLQDEKRSLPHQYAQLLFGIRGLDIGGRRTGDRRFPWRIVGNIPLVRLQRLGRHQRHRLRLCFPQQRVPIDIAQLLFAVRARLRADLPRQQIQQQALLVRQRDHAFLQTILLTTPV